MLRNGLNIARDLGQHFGSEHVSNRMRQQPLHAPALWIHTLSPGLKFMRQPSRRSPALRVPGSRQSIPPSSRS